MPYLSKRPTILDVASAAGVSYQTVSRVINSKAEVSEETREKVKRVIEELGYKPSAIARSLIQQRSYTLGVVTAGLKFIGPSRTLNGITQQAEEKGYTLLLKELPSFNTNNVQHIIDSLLSRHVDGLIWAAPEIGDNRKWLEEELVKFSIPVIFISMHPVDNFSVISIDNYLGGQIATQHLIECGYKNIGFISGPLDWWEARQRKRGWEKVQKEHSFAISENTWSEGNWSSSSGEEAFEKLIKQYPNMDAVFSANDQMALGVMSYAYKHHIRIPDDLAIIGFDDIAEAESFCPPLTTIRNDLLSVGRNAVNEIVSAIEDDREGKEHHSNNFLVSPELIVRQSTKHIT